MGKLMESQLMQETDKGVPEFDFDEWVKLAGEDPDGFEQARQRAIQAALVRTGNAGQGRLKGLCARIDREKAATSAPMASLLRMLEAAGQPG